MKNLRKITVATMLLFGTAFSWAANQINGDGTSSWTSTSSTTTIKAGDYLQLRDMKITFGDAEDTNTSWTWHGGNSGMIPNQMPSTDGTKNTLVTSFSTTSPFGTLPKRGNFFKLESVADGTVTINCKPSTDGEQKLIIVTMKEDNSAVEAATSQSQSTSSVSFDVKANRTYYFFQLAKRGQLTGYRFTFKGASFQKVKTDGGCAGNYSVSQPCGNTDYKCSYFNINSAAIAEALGMTETDFKANYKADNSGSVIMSMYNTEGKLVTSTNAGADSYSGYWMNKDGKQSEWATTGCIFFVFDPEGRIGIGQMPTTETGNAHVNAGEVITFPIVFSNNDKYVTVNVAYNVTADANQEYNLTTADTDFYSLCLGYDAIIPEGVEAYTGTIDAGKNVVKLEKVETIIPARSAVLVKSATAGSYTFKMTSDGVSVKANDIMGVLEDTNVTDIPAKGKTVLQFGIKNGEVGFRQPTADGIIKANRAYILVDAAAAAKPFCIEMGNEATGITTVKDNKVDNISYNIAGQRVNNNAKGLVIRGGKKYFNK